MSMIFKFRMLSDENDWFVRDYEVPYDMKLIDFNDFICRDLHFDKDGVTSFFTSNGLWEREREFTRVDMSSAGAGDAKSPEEGDAVPSPGEDGADGDGGMPAPMGEVLLSQVIHRNRDRLIFLFDVFDDRCLYLELTEAKKRAEGIEYPRVEFSKDDAPKQYGGGTGESGIFDDMMDDFDDFESYETDNFGDDL